MEQLLDAMYSAAYCLKDEFTIWFDNTSLYRQVWNNDKLLTELKENVGMSYAYTWRYTNDSLYLIGFKDIVYYPGSRIAWAWATGDTSFLTDREIKTLQAAQKLLNGLSVNNKDGEVATEKAIHDALVKKIKYTVQATITGGAKGALQEGDTAIGALLNGKADCDGYADAFYLLCYMNGYNVRYMHVTDRTDSQNGGHMLNQIQLPGGWYLVDVTWDDPDSGSLILYRCFNIGSGMAGFYYHWENTLFSTRLAEYADNDYTRVSYSFTGTNNALASYKDAQSYVKSQYSAGYRHLVFPVRGTDVTDQQVKKMTNRRYRWWRWQRDGYTFIELYFY